MDTHSTKGLIPPYYRLNLLCSYLYFCCSRELAETSPYLEALKKKDLEVLFLYEPYDELVLMNLGQFDKKFLKSIENEVADDQENTNTVDEKGRLAI